jgi:hypothetical protein
VFCLAVAGYPGCHEFLLMDDGKWVHVKETTGAPPPLLLCVCVCVCVGGRGGGVRGRGTGQAARVAVRALQRSRGRHAQRARGASLSTPVCAALRPPPHRTRARTEIGEGKLFAPGNLRATFDNPAYERLISHYLGEKYTLRCARARGASPRILTRAAPAPATTWPPACARAPRLCATHTPCARTHTPRTHTHTHTHTQVHGRHGARRVPDHRQGEGRVHQRDQPLHQGQAAHPV